MPSYRSRLRYQVTRGIAGLAWYSSCRRLGSHWCWSRPAYSTWRNADPIFASAGSLSEFSFSFLGLRGRECWPCGWLSVGILCLQSSPWKTMHQNSERLRSYGSSSMRSCWRPRQEFRGSCSGAGRSSKASARPSSCLGPVPAPSVRTSSSFYSRSLRTSSSCSRRAPVCPRRVA